jgi:PilZ domain
MKRRKRKHKPTQDLTPADPILIHSETEAQATPVELQAELENFASTLNFPEENEFPATPIAEPADIAEPAIEPPPESIPQTGADRRNHPRYAFAAAAEVVADESGARLKTRVRDLSQQGCLVDTDTPFALGTTTGVHITKGVESFEARARVVYNQPGKGMGLMFTAVEREHHATLNKWISESRETSWLAANRRRSQRVLMKVPVRVISQAGAATFLEEDTYTLAISVHGALLVVAAPVYRGQRFTLSNIQTRAALECIVAHVDKVPGEQTRIGVEFLMPNQTFWRVAFPPKDWTPRHPDAKSR